ncbi:hypothetical protein CY34DRAFT_809154 [Suillus luteus UH-Slu-Lm8-n1]|uniref:Heterokaryon incompatibility domain-containing protein n=1 Tax=Suillus luteus UH-Slu-Lm8-n1 TaxID=930992 RepID=A0A0C9ZM24_9AGAM|nr:hypothetical protein CY34DRAFT_809154 [Suillus luteus UH-Slu-Lm8-n1]
MAGAGQPAIRITTASRTFEGHEDNVYAAAVFPDKRRMVTASYDKTLRLWDLEDGVVLKIMEGHRFGVSNVVVSRDGQFIASGDFGGELITWNRDGEPLTQPIKVHSGLIYSLDFSPDSTWLASSPLDTTMELWNTKIWQVQGDPINCGSGAQILCIRYSPSGEHLAIATKTNIQIWNPRNRKCIAKFQGHSAFGGAWNSSLAWTLDGTRLLSAGFSPDPVIRVWDSSTWKQVGEPWKGHTGNIYMVALNPTGTLLASACDDNQVRLWRFSDQRTIAIFKHINAAFFVTFSTDGKHVLSGGRDQMISKWAVPLLDDILKDKASNDVLREDTPKGRVADNASPCSLTFDCKILAINTTVRNACVTGDLTTATKLLTQDIDADSNDYDSYANRSFVMARKADWDRALDDAQKSISIQLSLMGCISKGIAHCGKRQFKDAMKAFDLAFVFVDADIKKTRLLLLIKAIALFNANEHDEAILRVQELATTCPNADSLACGIVETYLHVQVGINALDDARHNDAADHFAAAVNAISFSSTSAIHSRYDIFVVLFGWDLKSLWLTAHQHWCRSLFRAGKFAEALGSYRRMIDRSNEATKTRCLDWSTAFKQDYCALYVATGVADLAAKGDDALAAGSCDRAIELYSAAIDLDFATDNIFANRSKARLGQMLWDDALLDAEKVIELEPSSYVGYQLKRTALHGAHRYDEAIDAFKIMLSKLENTSDTETTNLRQQYVSPSEVEGAIEARIKAQLDNAPHRLIDTSTGRLCNREAQINAFKTSAEYKQLLSSTTKHGDLRMERIRDVVAMYFRYVMLSHRWEGTEPLLHDIQGKVVYDLDPAGGITKLQSFCETTRDKGYRWAWIDTCCIDQTNNVEVQQSVNSMFVWYRHSALTIIYLSDVPPSSQPGALTISAWNTRGWTVQEFLAPKFVLFYQKDWSLYLDDCSPNHKDSLAIMQEMGEATGIDAQALVAFRPGMRDAREKLQWVSSRVTTWEEDTAYSLFGIFGVNLPVIYGEKKQKALGRLLQEVVAQSGDISALDWVGQSSEFNSCLPADITAYKAPPCALPSLSEDDIQTSISSLRHLMAVDLVLKLYARLDNLNAPRFGNCRLHLPCIAFRVTTVKRGRAQDQEIYKVRADGLHDLLVTTEDRLIPFSSPRPTMQTFLLVRPWNRYLLELPDFADQSGLAELPDVDDDMQSEDDYWSAPGSPSSDAPGVFPKKQKSIDSELSDRALRLIARLEQPFGAFLLAQQRGGEYKRIASDHDIIAQVKLEDLSSIMDMVRTLEIL